MSARYFQSTTPNELQTIRVNDSIVRGALTVAESSQLHSLNVDSGSSLKGSITFKPAPVLYTQTVSSGSAVAITGADECFDVNTFALTTAAGGIEAFNITHSGVQALDSVQLTQISYSGAYNVNGALVAHIAEVSAGIITVGIKNWGTGSANGAIKLRFKLFHNSN
jgi:hypothetical protein